MMELLPQRLMRSGVAGVVLCAVAGMALLPLPGSCAEKDSRFGMSGWRSFADLDKVGSSWFLTWGRSLSPAMANPDYPYVRMYWRTKANEFTDEEIQQWGRTVREQLGPGVPIWWTASNEPNDRQQANQTPEEFAAGYYQYHRNLRLGDPDCQILGPSILNWDFQSDSVWKKGREWYAEFRQAWASNPVWSAYSMSIQGNPYPPMDGFNLHTYDLRGIQGTPWEGPADWKYLRDQTLACYADLQTWPETKNLKIWNTEYGSLRVATITDTADTLGAFSLWLREQPFMERWFFFILRTGDGTWQQTVLMDDEGNVNSLGRAHHALSTMGSAEVANIPRDYTYLAGSNYIRPGTRYTNRISEYMSLGLHYVLMGNVAYEAGTMRGRTYTMPQRVKRVTFNYQMTCDPANFALEVDVPGQPKIWTSGDASGHQWADIDLSGHDTNTISLGLYSNQDNTYTGPTGDARVQVTNITFWYDDTVATTIAGARETPDYRRVRLADVVVSAVFADSFAVQNEDRSAGIIVQGSGVEVGERCTISGDLFTQNGYRLLRNPKIESRAPGAAPEPLVMNTRTSGGGASGLQAAVVDDGRSGAVASGLSTVGMLIRMAGRVGFVHPLGQFYYLDDGANIFDGSGLTGVRVSLEGQAPPTTGEMVDITGVCYTTLINGRPARLLRLHE